MTRRGRTSSSARIWIDQHARRAMVAHARSERPRECCGFLLGRGNVILFAAAVPNAAASATRYHIDPRAHIALRRALRTFAPPLDIVGVYHSHPAGRAWPSETDIADAHYLKWWHVIVGLGGARPEVRAFQIRRGQVESLRVSALRHQARPSAGV